MTGATVNVWPGANPDTQLESTIPSAVWHPAGGTVLRAV